MAKHWWILVAGIIIGLLSAGLILVASQPPRGAAILLRPPPSPAPVVVHVTGAVHEPGVYTLPANGHVEDAIQAAGGMTTEAERDLVNLAEPLQDGLQISVPREGQQSSESITTTTGKTEKEESNGEESASPTISYPININTATQSELESLPGIGPVTAQKIIAYRQENEFKIVEDIQKVSGIGPVTFEKIKDLISVGTSSQ